MAELMGLSSIAEVPAVIVNVQRGGPSTGSPNKSEQSDLFHAVYAGHGDAPRVVIACSYVESSFHATVDAFNIAEEFQVPVMVLTEQAIAQRRETITAGVLEHEVRERRIAMPERLNHHKDTKDTKNALCDLCVFVVQAFRSSKWSKPRGSRISPLMRTPRSSVMRPIA
jgi:2-oxoglutarate ferredoxin oxidoreductase subunit alpha